MASENEYPPFDPSAVEATPAERKSPARGSMRRRMMAIVLALTTIPMLLALTLSWFAASGAVRYTVRNQSTAMAERMAGALDREVNARVDALRVAASDPELAENLVDFAEGEGQEALPGTVYELGRGLSAEESPLDTARFFLLASGGRIIGELAGNRIISATEIPPGLAGAPLLSAMASTSPDSLFAGEVLGSTQGDVRLLVGQELTPPRETLVEENGEEGEPATHFYLVASFPLAPVLEEIEDVNPSLGQRLIVLSETRGVVYSPVREEELEESIGEMRDTFFGGMMDGFETPAVGTRRLGVAFSQLRSFQKLAPDPLPQVKWAVLQIVDLDEVASPVNQALWMMVLMALVMTVLAIVLAYWLSDRLVRPLMRVTQGVQRFAMGELDYRLDVRSGDEIEVLADAANDMAASLLRSYQDLGRRLLELDEKARQLELIHSISQSVNQALELDELFLRVTKEILEQIPCDRLSLSLIQEDTGALALAYVYPEMREDLPLGTEVPWERSVIAKAITDRLVTVRRLRMEKPYFEDNTLIPLGMKSLCVVPLMGGAGPIGSLNLASSDEGRFTKGEVRMLERIGENLAIAIEHSRLYTRVSRFATELEETVEERTQELKKAQAKLLQTEKFAAAGSMAANIAHEVNNPLSIIKNYIKILRGQIARVSSELDEGPGVQSTLDVITEEIDRIARIVSQLRQVSTPSRPRYATVDIRQEIRTLIELFYGTLKKHSVSIDFEEDPALVEVRLCSDYFRQIMINLIRNSIDALDSGGKIVIRTRAGLEHEQLFCVEVIDSGMGIPEENLGMIFDPFFTTKTEGKGTGLGLSVSFGLAQTMGGTLEAESKVGVGTTMRLMLPLTPADEQEESESPQAGAGSPEQAIRRRGKKIIIG
ncbi:GAF domain-containing protein [bacterium]|nr:GAF domain-containing protein [bacterium]